MPMLSDTELLEDKAEIEVPSIVNSSVKNAAESRSKAVNQDRSSELAQNASITRWRKTQP